MKNSSSSQPNKNLNASTNIDVILKRKIRAIKIKKAKNAIPATDEPSK